jgi:hypothetical protein
MIDEPLDQNEFEPELETKSPPRAHQVPVETSVKTERTTERILVEPNIEPSRVSATDERQAPAPKPDRNAVTVETLTSPPEPSRTADSSAQESPAVNIAPLSQSRDETPPAPKPPAPEPSDQPVLTQDQQSSRSEKPPDRKPPQVVSAPPETEEPERKTVAIQSIIHTESPRASEPERKAEKADVMRRAEKPEPPDQPVAVKVGVPPKSQEDGETKIERIATRMEPKPATPLAGEAANVTEPILKPLTQARVSKPPAQAQVNTDSQSDRQASPGGVTVRIGSIQIMSKGKTQQRPQTIRRPARSHKIEPRLPFASGR